MRTVHLLEAAGAAAVQLEDQQMPKSCGHFDSHELVESGELVAKLRAAVAARSDANTLVIARTDALGVLGVDEALRRGHRYLDAGADVLFVEAPTTERQLERIAHEFAGVPLVANIVEGGRTPQISAKELGDLGYTIVLYANFLMRVMAYAGRQGLAVLRDAGDTRSLADSMLSWQERQTLVDLDRFKNLEHAFDQIAVTTSEEETPDE
jgi:2-methylisocitrate lyase-like PEP mutase family enzyme